MTTIYLHIGTHKTGTTTIQRFLFENRDKLLSMGYLVPLAGRPRRRPNHIRLAMSTFTDQFVDQKSDFLEQNLKQDWEKLAQEIEAHQSQAVIISSERFCALKPSEIEVLKDYLSAYKIRIILYLRRQDSFLRSLHCQNVKGNGKEWRGTKASIKKIIHRGDYLELISDWERVFGEGNLTVKGFEKSCKEKGLITSFFDAIGLETDLNQFTINRDRNISPPVKIIKAMRFLNRITDWLDKVSVPTKDFHKKYRTILMDPKRRFSKFVMGLPEFILSNELLTEEEQIAILHKFSKVNQTISERYLPPEERPLFDDI